MGYKTKNGILRSTRGQFGAIEIFDTFNEGILMVLGDLLEAGVSSYADDICIMAETFEKCLSLLEEVLKRLRANGYVIQASKVVLFKSELNILGQLVS